MERFLTRSQLSKDIADFNKLPNSNRNAQDLRFGQFFINKHTDKAYPNAVLFYTEKFDDCLALINQQYLLED